MRTMSEIKTEVDALWASRLREAGLLGRSVTSLNAQEKATLDEIVTAVNNHAAGLRESAGGSDESGLIDPPVRVCRWSTRRSVPRRSCSSRSRRTTGRWWISSAMAFRSRRAPPATGRLSSSRLREADRAKDADSDKMPDLRGLGIPLRESSFGAGDEETFYPSPDTQELLQDLFTCLPETLPNGSENLEAAVVKRMLEDLTRGHQLAPVDVAKMKELVVKHQSEIKALRESRDKQGQDFDAVPDPASGREVTDDDRATGLLDLGSGVPTKAAAA